MPAEEVYVPWGHLKQWPQWLRTILLGEAPPFDFPKEFAAWKELTETQQIRLKETTPNEIIAREKSLANTRDTIKVCATVLAFVFGGLIAMFVLRPHGFSAVLLALSVSFTAFAVITLMRAIMPPPHTLGTNFSHPFEWVKGEQGREAQTEDELFVAKSIDALLQANHTTQFLKRSQVYATLVAVLAFLTLVAFLFVEFVF